MAYQIQYPFTAVVGQDDFKLALILCIIDPTIGGVLALGDKGTGKTTLVRSLTQLMSDEDGSFPFVNLPIGATEDRVLGNVDIERLINDKKQVIQKGLLAKAHNGILYIDEINLLNDYLMDVLLDASSSGSYFLERDGISKSFDSRFCLVGTMNPEEGDLRPQLKDRFGLSVIISTPKENSVRTSITKNRLAFDAGPGDFYSKFESEEQVLRERILKARNTLKDIKVSDDNISLASDRVLQRHAEGMRADILIVKAARALAALNNKVEVEAEDIEKVAPLVLDHRANSHSAPSPDNGKQPWENEKKKPIMMK